MQSEMTIITLSDKKKIQSGLPEAWRILVKEADENLIKVVAEKTANVCGHRPDDEQVIAFLKRKNCL